MLIQNVVFNECFIQFLDLFPPFYVNINNNNLYFRVTSQVGDNLSISQSSSCRKQGDTESGMIGRYQMSDDKVR